VILLGWVERAAHLDRRLDTPLERVGGVELGDVGFRDRGLFGIGGEDR
jgi:hypothetical protein